MSLSAWLQAAGLERAAKQQGERSFRDLEALDAFFAECAARETGREPDWEENKAAIARSFSRGNFDT
jgi:hypothetical protein